MAIREEKAWQIVAVLRRHLDQPTLDKIIDEVMELRGDKEFREAVNLFAWLIRTG
jgi:hypothetical protein